MKSQPGLREQLCGGGAFAFAADVAECFNFGLRRKYTRGPYVLDSTRVPRVEKLKRTGSGKRQKIHKSWGGEGGFNFLKNHVWGATVDIIAITSQSLNCGFVSSPLALAGKS